ncbi:MAPEG family protein [Sphingomonas lycopersici]|uniref:MAPEG family protein n=1 Tax=Sphingomonas lycopersici TaxID=2951807 RepID=A0AA41ZAY1_9SPHN|nr:MAPEG family protein [Sphingomonas lycopersici]MCW6533336.1 MAPEG family protein [Sphingomonas lycopersici]
MAQELIFWPMIVMALLTFVPLAMMPIKRIQSAVRGDTTPDDYRFGESARVPTDVALPNRNYMNTLEVPLLFHVLLVALYAAHRVDIVFVSLAWAYVLLRSLHSFIHLTYNRVTHRVVPFAASNFVLIAMWLLFALSLFRFGHQGIG